MVGTSERPRAHPVASVSLFDGDIGAQKSRERDNVFFHLYIDEAAQDILRLGYTLDDDNTRTFFEDTCTR